ncbi:MAG TPA: hypothetical protein V6D02_16760 [Candidatus Obscuribacterales bacterium]
MRAILHHPDSSSLAVMERPELPAVPPSRWRRSRSGWLTLACDCTCLVMAVGAGLVCRAAVAAVWPATGNGAERTLVESMSFWGTVTPAVWFLWRDAWRWGRRDRPLPFDYGEAVTRQLYGQRCELGVWAIAANFTLLCLCLLMPQQPLFSKLFLSSIVALVALAVRQSIPAQRLAFAASTGVFSLAMLLIGIAGVALR